jgi:hypothetical protein
MTSALRGQLARGNQFRIENRFFFSCDRRAYKKVLETFLQDFEAPLCFFGFYVDYLERCFGVYRVRREISKVPNRVDRLMQLAGDRLSWISFVEKQIYFCI